MDYLAILDDHLSFIERFYNTAAEPFETTIRKIEAEEEPFVPRYARGDHDGPEFMDEWSEADKCVAVLGSCSLGLLEKALHDYLREFVTTQGGPGPKKSKKESWFEHHCRFLEEHTAFRWENFPVSKHQIEEINLTRNTFVHDETLGGTWPFQSEHHFRRNPVPAFADKLYLTAVAGEVTPEIAVALKVTHDNLTAHVEHVRQFCTFVESQRTN